MVLTSMLMSMSILSLKLEFENVLMSMLIVNPERNDIVEQYVTECVQRFLIMKASKQNLQNSFPSFKVFYLFMYLFIGIIY